MKKYAYILLAALGFASCNYLEIDPIGQVIPHKTSEYRALLTESYFRFPYIDSKALTGMLSDETDYLYDGKLYSSNYVALSHNFVWDYSSQMHEMPYETYYRAIFLANAVIDDVMDSEQDSAESKEQIMGEAYAIRAYSHFDLVNLYGKAYDPVTAATDRGVPLSVEIDIEQKYRPASVEAIYTQILKDIEQAEKLMDVEKQPDATLSYRFSLNALEAFKARVLLYMRNWQGAYDAATALMPAYALADLNDLGEKGEDNLPWKATSTESILAWERPFGFSSGDLFESCALSDEMLARFDKATDNRRNYIKEAVKRDPVWGDETPLGYYIPDRSSSDRVSIRIAEMYLIAAEAGSYLPAELDNARTHLLTLQSKRLRPEAMEAQRTKVQAMNADELRAEIADERARELIGEGHRWMDLRRTTRPAITRVHEEVTYRLQAGDSRYTLPFPQSAINNNPELNN